MLIFAKHIVFDITVCAHQYVWDYLIPSHQSVEKGSAIALDHLHLKPFIQMELRLGEGSGATLAMPFIDAAHAMYNRMGRMEDNGMDLPSPA
jgi:nicotinate-nucleotide--dimethylbenzimidazole phosphoribosyltransferase